MRNEYPRPDFVRKEWLCLNGTWQLESGGQHTAIEVPFACQAKLSGAKVHACDTMRYERTFLVPQKWKGQQILLHFGAVDYQCEVWVNGQMAGTHTGGHTPFTFDITPLLCGGEEKLAVLVYDPLQDETIPRGKQFWEEKPRFIWYTPTSGIWQSVWLEPVEQSAIRQVRFTPDIDSGTVTIAWRLRAASALPCTLHITVCLKGAEVAECTTLCRQTTGTLTLDIFHGRAMEGAFHFTGNYWSPETPLLYDVKLELSEKGHICDTAESYFGMRQICVRNHRIYLNQRPYYQKLLLDQGYWKDGGLTAPSDDDYRNDILKMKAMGFNGCRKHEKVEDPRFLYWADRLGFLVWESMPSFWSYTLEACSAFSQEWRETIQRDYSHPCVVAWEMLNESWGVPQIYDNSAQQSFARSLFYMAKSMDTTRLVVGNDGWEQTDSDICALHSYMHGSEENARQQQKFALCLRQPENMAQIMEKTPYAKGFSYQGQPLVLTECGGISVQADAVDASRAAQQSESWGYTSVAGEQFLATYQRLIKAIREADDFCGFCYTQLADIEQETNGLLTEEHRLKFDSEKLRAINDTL